MSASRSLGLACTLFFCTLRYISIFQSSFGGISDSFSFGTPVMAWTTILQRILLLWYLFSNGSEALSLHSFSTTLMLKTLPRQQSSTRRTTTTLWAEERTTKERQQHEGKSSRRLFIAAILCGTVIGSTPVTAKNNAVANAFDRKAYPIELYASDASSRDPLLDKKDAIIDRNRPMSDDYGVGGKLLRGGVWGSALWFLSGSRSNPLATPLANVLYNDQDEAWLKDRNDGWFAGLPPSFLIVLAVTFGLFGFGVDQVATMLADNDADVSLQLAGVSLIGGCSLELGRIASGEKKPTREEAYRSSQLETEFAEFAEKRLIAGGNCHRNEVVRAFRRYYAKYRQANSEQYPLSDLEIEQMLRNYCRQNGLEMSSAGFYTGIQINSDADVFVKR